MITWLFSPPFTMYGIFCDFSGSVPPMQAAVTPVFAARAARGHNAPFCTSDLSQPRIHRRHELVCVDVVTATLNAAFSVLGSSTCSNGVVLDPAAPCDYNVHFTPDTIGLTTQQLTVVTFSRKPKRAALQSG
jgi:hypothetical protein